MKKTLLAILLVFTCGFLGCITTSSEKAGLSVEIIDVALTSPREPQPAQATLRVRIHNDDVVPYVVEEMDHTVRLGERITGRIKSKKLIGLPKLDSVPCELVLELNAADASTLRSLLDAGSFSYRFNSRYTSSVFGESQLLTSQNTGLYRCSSGK